VGPNEKGTDAFSQDIAGRICSPFGDALVSVPESMTGLPLLASGRESTWCREPNASIRPVEYQRNTVPISWELNPNSESCTTCREVLVMRGGALTGVESVNQEKGSAAGRIPVVGPTQWGC